jgi:hypothetical protein
MLRIRAAVYLSVLALIPIDTRASIPELQPSAISEVEYFIYPSYISRIMNMEKGEVEKSYLIRLHFRSGAVLNTELGALTKALLDGVSQSSNQRVDGDFRYAIAIYGNGASTNKTLYLDGFSPIGVIDGRRVDLNPEVFRKLKKCLDGYGGRG